jgi:hypothetical protein
LGDLSRCFIELSWAVHIAQEKQRDWKVNEHDVLRVLRQQCPSDAKGMQDPLTAR